MANAGIGTSNPLAHGAQQVTLQNITNLKKLESETSIRNIS